jgi:hypothetical protein
MTAAFVAVAALAAPTVAFAQRAAPRGPARPVAVRPTFRSSVFIGGFGFGYPHLYNPWWGDYGYGYGYPYGGYPLYVDYSNWDVASLRIEVKPREAEVFVDGYHAGIVDNFDGIFQRLHVRPGGHEISIYMPGFRTFTTRVYASPSSTQSIKMYLQPLAPGEAMAPPPRPTVAPQMGPQPAPGYGRGGGGGMRVMPPVQVGPGGTYQQPQGPPPVGDQGLPPIPPGATPVDPNAPMPPVAAVPVPEPLPADPSAYGTLALRVQPSGGPGTVILIDGERWAAPSSGDQLLVRLAEGRHHVEIRRPGFTTFVSDVNVKRGEGSPLNVSLVRR